MNGLNNLLSFLLIVIFSFILQYLMQRYIVSVGYEIDKRLGYLFCFISGIIISYIYYSVGLIPIFLIYSLLIQVLTLISLVDFKNKLIPNRLNLAVALIGICTMVYFGTYKDSILAFLLSGTLFFAFALISNGGIGGGDIKLIAPLGLIFGVFNTLFIICYSFIFGAIVGVIMIILRKGNLKSELAMGPYISLATIFLVIFYHM